jgi:hypothetical protein
MGILGLEGDMNPLIKLVVILTPPKALPSAKPRHLRHDASKSADPFDLCTTAREGEDGNKQKQKIEHKSYNVTILW